MKSLLLYGAFMLCSISIWAQNTFIVYLRDKKTNEPIIGATVNLVKTSNGTASDVNGFVKLGGIPDGKQVLCYRSVGYGEYYDTVYFPVSLDDTSIVYLQASEEDLEEVTVSSTRSSRTIQDVATRIELISGEEVGEKANMKPGDIRMLLSESTGIQTLQTSATSANSSIRIQGLDGKYTQILKDGYPLYAGFSGGLGLMQTPPLDLKRVEIIKGASSTLYGGGAIAGLINLISKTPSKEGEFKLIVNATSAMGLDASGFYSKQWGKLGVTVFTAFNGSEAYAPASTVFSAIPRFQRVTLNPKLFWTPNAKTDIIFGINSMYEMRKGGDMLYLQGKGDSIHRYFEDNSSERVSVTLDIKRKFDNTGVLTFRNAVNHFNRIISATDNSFDGTQTGSFSELSYSIHKGAMDWVVGGNVYTDHFIEKKLTVVGNRDYQLSTFGGFVQNTWDISKKFVLETGLRTDYVNHYGTVVLPRLSMLFKTNGSFSSRLGGGLGYKAPTIFTEESERISYKDILPVNADSNILERSYGANWDVNYKTSFCDGEITFAFNELLFITQVQHPLVLTPQINNLYRYENSPARIDAKGSETNVKLGYKHFKLFLGYTYTHSHIHNLDVFIETPLTPRHHTNSVLMYEVENKIKIGLEAYYYSPQRLSDGLTGMPYTLCGFMVEKIWKKVSVYINFENMLDVRQTRFDSIYSGSISSPRFRDIYAPLDGFVTNGGIKLSL